MKLRLLLGIISVCLGVNRLSAQTYSYAPEHPLKNSADIRAAIKQLGNTGRVLYLAAHPDDENQRVMAWLTKANNYTVAYLSLTRGDGGQNLLGTEKGEALGLLRTQELLEARKIDGAYQFFTRATDFGYSKNPEETYEHWNKDSVLSDVVFVIRKFQPQVIITRFPTNGQGGHGHHTASALLAQEAFKLAADPKAYPEQLRYVDTWQTERLCWNSFNRGRSDEEAAKDVNVNVQQYIANQGKSIGEFAMAARSKHLCQGFGTYLKRDDIIESFYPELGSSFTTSPIENINTSWRSLKGYENIDILTKDLLNNFNPDAPEASITSLVSIRKILSTRKKHPAFITLKLKDIDELILACSGVYITASTTKEAAIAGDSLDFELEVIANNSTLNLNSVRANGTLIDIPTLELEAKENKNLELSLICPTELSVTNWLKANTKNDMYSWPNKAQVGMAYDRSQITLAIDLDVNGNPISLYIPLIHKSAKPETGEIVKPLPILPAAYFVLENEPVICPNGQEQAIAINLQALKGFKGGTINISADGFNISPNTIKITELVPGQKLPFTIKVKPINTNAETKSTLAFSFKDGDGNSYTKSIQSISYPHIEEQFLIKDASLEAISFPLKYKPGNIAFIQGAGEVTPNVLSKLGYSVTLLNAEDLFTADLSQYKALIVGIRAYNLFTEVMQQNQNKLNTYVENGGVMLTQYQTSYFISSVDFSIAPKDFTISRNRVTNEFAEVIILDKKHPVLNYPNKITSKTFEGWVQERGLYFGGNWDKGFTPLFSMHDKGEDALEGSTLVLNHGKGRFIYTGISLFRELPAGVPGAYALLINYIEKQ